MTAQETFEDKAMTLLEKQAKAAKAVIDSFVKSRGSLNVDVYTAMPAIIVAVREAVDEEREECAKLAESLDKPSVEGAAQMVRTEACCDIAAAIRDRSLSKTQPAKSMTWQQKLDEADRLRAEASREVLGDPVKGVSVPPNVNG